MADPVDFTDPCATAAWLRSIYYQRVAGQGVTSIKFGEREVKYSSASFNDTQMLAEIQRLDEQCALKMAAAGDGTAPRRRAIQLGARGARICSPFSLITRDDGT
jgi:hypothetical protein